MGVFLFESITDRFQTLMGNWEFRTSGHLSYVWTCLMFHWLNSSLNFVGVKPNPIGSKGLTFFIDLGVIETHHRVTMKQMNLVVVAKRILWSFSNLQIQYGKITFLPGPPSHIVLFWFELCITKVFLGLKILGGFLKIAIFSWKNSHYLSNGRTLYKTCSSATMLLILGWHAFSEAEWCLLSRGLCQMNAIRYYP